MAETPAKAPAAPRTRTARPRPASAAKATPAKKPTPAKAAPKKPEPFERFTVDLEANGETASYSKWAFPKGSGCVGNVYAPLGTGTVKVLVVPADEAAATA